MTSYSIIGAGAIGTALAQQFSRKNIRAKIANTRGRESLSDLTADLGGRLSTEVVAEAVPGARVVNGFNTLPAAALARVPDDHGRRIIFLSGNNSRPMPKSPLSRTHSGMRRSSLDPSTTANPRNSVAR